MVEAIGKVGCALGIATVAECVESEAALKELRAIGVDYAQGFHLATPPRRSRSCPGSVRRGGGPARVAPIIGPESVVVRRAAAFP